MNRMLLSAIVFVVVTGGVYVLCGNAHIDIFPCEIAEKPLRSPGDIFGRPARLEKKDGTCSLLAHNRGVDPDGEYQRLTGAGWGLLALFCAGIGAVTGLLAGWLFGKKPA